MEKRRFNIIEMAMKHRQIAVVLTTLLVLLGVYALVVMPRNEFPEFTIRQGLIVGIYPGATSEQVEEQLATNVESFLYGFKEVNRAKTYSISKEGMLIVFVEVNNNVDDPDAFWDKIKFGLDQLKPQLPPQVLALIANNEFGETSALLLTVQSESKSYRELEEELKIIETELRKIEAVSKVRHFGLQREQITIYPDKDKLAHYGVKPISVLAAMQMEGSVYYSGELENGELITPIHVPNSFRSEEDIRNQILYADPNGNVVRVKDVAQVIREYPEPDSYIKNNGKKSLLISLEMQTGNNIVQFGEEVDETLAHVQTLISPDVSVSKIADMPSAVGHAIKHFLKEFMIAILAVVVVIILLLPFRVAAVAGVTIPISIFITLGVLYMIGTELHTVSLAGLIVVLGMVVDNSIVIIDSHVEKLDHGDNPWQAAWKSATELFVPVFSATLIIFCSYLPMPLFLEGQSGDFLVSLPITIGVALLASLLVAYLLVPYMCFVFIKQGLHKKEATPKDKKSLLDYLQKAYDKMLEMAMQWPKLTLLAGLLSVVAGGMILAILPQQLFPKVERNQFAVEIYLPEGSTLEQTAFVADSMENMLLADSRVENVATFIGESSPRFHTTYAPQFPAKNYAQLVVNTQNQDQVPEILDEYERTKRNHFPNAYVRMKQLDMLATSAPIEVRISGSSLDSIKLVAQQVEEIMHDHESVIWVRNDYKKPRLGLRLDIDDERANRLGVTRGSVAMSVATGMSGLPVGTVWEGDYPIDVKVMSPKDERNDYADIGNLPVASPLTASRVTVRQVADITNDWTEGQIVRRNGVKTITVRADVQRDKLAYKVLGDLKKGINQLDLDDQVKIGYGGEEESQIESFVPMSIAFAVSIFLIFIILLFQFKTVSYAFLIMTTMPLSLLGAGLGLWLTQYPFGLTAFVGIISLMGIVVRNGIILIDYAIELQKKQGLSLYEAALAAGKRRMRPIFLTSFAAAVGVVPMILSGSTLWGPLGSVVCFGLLVSMLLTLIVLPVLYNVSFGRTENKLQK
ncbi:efflux RND transporter permease subunit [bacterium SCSIO 12741]|nr:efflux RND transporter permease subunit [bacterium SCSIO 12741]